MKLKMITLMKVSRPGFCGQNQICGVDDNESSLVCLDIGKKYSVKVDQGNKADQGNAGSVVDKAEEGVAEAETAKESGALTGPQAASKGKVPSQKIPPPSVYFI